MSKGGLSRSGYLGIRAGWLSVRRLKAPPLEHKFAVLTSSSLCLFDGREDAESFFHLSFPEGGQPTRCLDGYLELRIPKNSTTFFPSSTLSEGGQAQSNESEAKLLIYDKGTPASRDVAWLELTAVDEADLCAWRQDIAMVASHVSSTIQGYAFLRASAVPYDTPEMSDPTLWRRIYVTYAPWRRTLYLHHDHWHAHVASTEIQLEDSSNIALDNWEVLTLRIFGDDKSTQTCRLLLKFPSQFESERWFGEISTSLLQKSGSDTIAPPDSVLVMEKPSLCTDPVVKEGHVLVCSPTDKSTIGTSWKSNYWKLTEKGKILRYHDSYWLDPLPGSIQIRGSESCSISDSSSQLTLTLSSGDSLVHVRSGVTMDCEDWLDVLESMIGKMRLLNADQGQGTALKHLAGQQFQNEYYDVVIRSSMALGITFGNAHGTPVVEASNFLESVTEGSILVSIGGKSLIGTSFSNTMSFLQSGWTPPLTLGFVRAPCLTVRVKWRTSGDKMLSEGTLRLEKGFVRIYRTGVPLESFNDGREGERGDLLEEFPLHATVIRLEPRNFNPSNPSKSTSCKIFRGREMLGLKSKTPMDTILLGAILEQARSIAEGELPLNA